MQQNDGLEEYTSDITLLPEPPLPDRNYLEAQREWIRDYFIREMMPVLTPIGLDPSHPFPRVLNKSLNFAVELEGKDAFGRSSGAAIVQAPRVLPRVIRLPKELAAANTASSSCPRSCTNSSASCSPA
jgi:polyphosphate kinase